MERGGVASTLCYNLVAMKHLYLFTLEIVPLEVGKSYDELPLHLTLMSRFLSELSPDELVFAVQYVFARASPVALVFGDIEELGPKKIAAYMISSQSEKTLHNELYRKLSALKIEYQYPQFVGTGHRAHVSAREGLEFERGHLETALVGYLIEVVDRKRIVRARFELNDLRKEATL